MCRKVAMADSGGEIEIWGDGRQTRSFLYIDECIEGSLRLMRSEFEGPVNIGSDEMVTINDLVAMVASASNKRISIKHIDGPLGVRGRNSDNELIFKKLAWRPSLKLQEGIDLTYPWIVSQISSKI